jgi:hypothetical protein
MASRRPSWFLSPGRRRRPDPISWSDLCRAQFWSAAHPRPRPLRLRLFPPWCGVRARADAFIDRSTAAPTRHLRCASRVPTAVRHLDELDHGPSKQRVEGVDLPGVALQTTKWLTATSVKRSANTARLRRARGGGSRHTASDWPMLAVRSEPPILFSWLPWLSCFWAPSWQLADLTLWWVAWIELQRSWSDGRRAYHHW